MHYQVLFSSTRFFDFAYVAVDLFFVLSGIVISMNYGERISQGISLAAFVCNRLARLYPLYLLTSAVGFIHAYALYAAGKYDPNTWKAVGDIPSMLANLAMLPNVRIGGSASQVLFPFNGPAWSVFAEIWVNILFFVWARAGGRHLAFIVLLAAAALIVAAGDHGNVDGGWGSVHMAIGLLRAIFGFFIGVAIWKHRSRFARVFGAVPVEVYAVLILVHPLFSSTQIVRELVVVLVLVPGCVASALVNRSMLLENPVARWLGVISYGVYLWQIPFGAWLGSAARQGLGIDLAYKQPWGGLAWLIGLLVLASLSYYFIEAPTRRFLRRLTDKLVR